MSSAPGPPASGAWALPPTDANLNFISQEYSYEDVHAATDGFSATCRLGQGTYGSVYQGTLRDGTEVAIKTLSKPNEAGFREEVEVLSRFRHPNLVILMGFARHNKDRYLVYELLGGGDVCARLQKNASFSWRPRLSVALDAALGLSHLHCSRPQVFHRDIKTQNILMDRNGTGKMADFGLALLAQPDCTSLTVEHTSGTIGYADPLYIRTGVVTERSEVYSFGMVLLEVLTGRPPALQHTSGRIEFQFTHINGEVARVRAMLDIRGQWPAALALGLGKLALRCIDENEMLRPTFVEIVGILRQLLTNNPENRTANNGLGVMPVAPASSASAAPAGPAASPERLPMASFAGAADQWLHTASARPAAARRPSFESQGLVRQAPDSFTGDLHNPFAIGSRAGATLPERPVPAAASSQGVAEPSTYGATAQGTGFGNLMSGVFGSHMGAGAAQSCYAMDGVGGHQRLPPAFVPSNGVGIDPTAPVGSFSQAGTGISFQVGTGAMLDRPSETRQVGAGFPSDTYSPAMPSWSTGMAHGSVAAFPSQGVQVGSVHDLELEGLPELRPVDFGDNAFTDSGPVAVLDCGAPPISRDAADVDGGQLADARFAATGSLEMQDAGLLRARASSSRGAEADVIWIDPRPTFTLDSERARQNGVLLPEMSSGSAPAHQPGHFLDVTQRYGGQLDPSMFPSAHAQRSVERPPLAPEPIFPQQGGPAEHFMAPWALHQTRAEAMATGPGGLAPPAAPFSSASGSAPKTSSNPDQEAMMVSLQHDMGFSRTQVVEAFKRCSTAEAAIEWILSPERDWG